MITKFEILDEHSRFKNKLYLKVESLEDNINDHLLKLIYCHFYDNNNRDMNHWKGELGGWLGWFLTKKSSTKNKMSDILWSSLISNDDLDDYNEFEFVWDSFFKPSKYMKKEHNLEYQPCTKEIHKFFINLVIELFESIDNRDKEKFSDIIDKI